MKFRESFETALARSRRQGVVRQVSVIYQARPVRDSNTQPVASPYKIRAR